MSASPMVLCLGTLIVIQIENIWEILRSTYYICTLGVLIPDWHYHIINIT